MSCKAFIDSHSGSFGLWMKGAPQRLKQRLTVPWPVAPCSGQNHSACRGVDLNAKCLLLNNLTTTKVHNIRYMLLYILDSVVITAQIVCILSFDSQ